MFIILLRRTMHATHGSGIYRIYSNKTRLCSRSAKPPPLTAKAKISTKSYLGIPDHFLISGLIRIWIRMSAGSLSKCCGFITLWRQSFRRVSWKLAGNCMRNANTPPQSTHTPFSAHLTPKKLAPLLTLSDTHPSANFRRRTLHIR